MPGACVRIMGIRRAFPSWPGLHLLEAFREKHVTVHFIKAAVLKIHGQIPTSHESLLSLAQTEGICFQNTFMRKRSHCLKEEKLGV